MKNSTLKYEISGALSFIGLFFLASPLLLYGFIHGDYDRYIWIINGPHPFSSFGGGPFQMWMFIGLTLIGALFIALSGCLKGRGTV